MRKVNENFSSVLINYYLTELCTLKKGKKKGLGSNQSVYNITTEMLSEHGLHSDGATTIGDLTFIHFRLNRKFPAENSELFDQIYGYDNLKVDIGLPFETDQCAFSFEYDTNNKSCTLRKNVWGRVEKLMYFETFNDLWVNYKNAKSFEKVLQIAEKEIKTEK